MIFIRRAPNEDILDIVDMHLKLQRHLEASKPYIWRTSQSRSQITETYQNKDLILYIATQNNTTTGYICGQIQTRENMTPQTVGFIRNIYVKPKHRQKSTAPNLIKTLCKHYTQQNVDEVNFRYVKGNKEATQLWNKLEFLQSLHP